LLRDYVSTKTTPISEAARRDIADYERIKADLSEYLRSKIGSNEVSKAQFNSIFNEYLDKALPKEELERYRRDSVVSKLYGFSVVMLGIKIGKDSREEEKVPFGPYRINEIEQAVKQAKLN
jgi:hypothetical protein